MGEVYRKKNDKEKAAQYYQRILLEFPEEKSLTELSRQNLEALGLSLDRADSGNVSVELSEEQKTIQRLKELMKKSPKNPFDSIGEEEEMVAAIRKNHIEVVKLLLERGKDSNALLNVGQPPASWGGTPYTPLFSAAYHGKQTIMDLLLSHQADIRIKSGLGYSPMAAAVAGGQVEAARKLIENGADAKDLPTGNQRTLIEISFSYGFKPEILKFLLTNGADPERRNPSGLTALQSSLLNIEANRSTTVWDIIPKILLKHDVDPKPERFTNTTNAPIVLALKGAGIRVDSIESLVESLVKAGADINARDHQGATSLFRAIAGMRHATIRKLLHLGAGPNIHHRQAPEVIPMCDSSPVAHRICFQPARPINLPAPTADLDAFLQCMTRATTFTVMPAGGLCFLPRQQPFQGAGTAGENFRFILGSQLSIALLIGWQPYSQLFL